MGKPFGYWTFANKNGLLGGPSTLVELPDGRFVIQKYEGNPEVLPDEVIVYGLQHSRKAQTDFKRLFPTLDEVSQDRLRAVLMQNPLQSKLTICEQDQADALQKLQVTTKIRTH